MNAAPEPGTSPGRIVSLVPSVTDSLITLGYANRLVGITDYCPMPPGPERIVRVGGTIDADPEKILALQPDLVIANREENRPGSIEPLEQAGISVWVTSPKTVRDALAELRDLALIFAGDDALQKVVWLERAVDWLEGSRNGAGTGVFCPIWPVDEPKSGQKWLTLAGDTYASDLLRVCGGENIFAGYPGGRYPAVSLDEIAAAAPEVVLFPDEPFAFGQAHADALRAALPDLPAVTHNRIHLLDGRLLFWHGTRLGESIRKIPAFFPDFTDAA